MIVTSSTSCRFLVWNYLLSLNLTFIVYNLDWLSIDMVLMYLQLRLLRKCQRKLCHHWVNQPLVSRFCKDHYNGFFGGNHMLEVFESFFLYVSNQMPWRNLRTIVLLRDFLHLLLWLHYTIHMYSIYCVIFHYPVICHWHFTTTDSVQG